MLIILKLFIRVKVFYSIKFLLGLTLSYLYSIDYIPAIYFTLLCINTSSTVLWIIIWACFERVHTASAGTAFLVWKMKLQAQIKFYSSFIFNRLFIYKPVTEKMAHVKLYCTQIISQLICITWDTFLITECLQYTVVAALGSRDIKSLTFWMHHSWFQK